MRNTRLLTIVTVALVVLLSQGSKIHAESMGTVFTYQGRLIDGNDVADGLYDFQFKLYDASSDGNQINSNVNKPDIDVIDGYFTVELDFNDPNAFNGNARWLEIGVRDCDPCDVNAFTTLSPLQELTPTPYAIYAKSAGGDNDWMVSGDDMYSIPSGNVGIGTTEPEKKLDIASYSYTDLGIGLRTDTPGGTSWSIDNDAGVFKIVEHASCGPEFGNNTRIAVVGNCIGSPYGGNVGVGTTDPNAKLEVAGDLKVTGAYRGNISSSSGSDGAPFPRPAYDSGWVSINPDENKTLTHNIGGNVDNYVVDLQFKDLGPGGIHILGHGSFEIATHYYGAHWTQLTNTTIGVYRRPDDVFIDEIRVRIWVYN